MPNPFIPKPQMELPPLVLRNFGFKLIQTQFKPNQTKLKPFGLEIFWIKTEWFGFQFGGPKLSSNHFKLIKESRAVWHVFSTLYEVLAKDQYVYIIASFKRWFNISIW